MRASRSPSSDRRWSNYRLKKKLKKAYGIDLKTSLHVRLLFSDAQLQRGEEHVPLEPLSPEKLQPFVQHNALYPVTVSNESP